MMKRAFALCVLLAALTLTCEEPPETEPLARGRQLYRKLDCARCHVIDGQGGQLGPDLSRIGDRAGSRAPGQSADEYIRRSIVSPGDLIVPGYNDVMPRGLARGLSEADLDALVLFLKRPEQGPGGP